jgi:hypothetical protein
LIGFYDLEEINEATEDHDARPAIDPFDNAAQIGCSARREGLVLKIRGARAGSDGCEGQEG